MSGEKKQRYIRNPHSLSVLDLNCEGREVMTLSETIARLNALTDLRDFLNTLLDEGFGYSVEDLSDEGEREHILDMARLRSIHEGALELQREEIKRLTARVEALTDERNRARALAKAKIKALAALTARVEESRLLIIELRNRLEQADAEYPSGAVRNYLDSRTAQVLGGEIQLERDAVLERDEQIIELLAHVEALADENGMLHKRVQGQGAIVKRRNAQIARHGEEIKTLTARVKELEAALRNIGNSPAFTFADRDLKGYALRALALCSEPVDA